MRIFNYFKNKFRGKYLEKIANRYELKKCFFVAKNVF